MGVEDRWTVGYATTTGLLIDGIQFPRPCMSERLAPTMENLAQTLVLKLVARARILAQEGTYVST